MSFRLRRRVAAKFGIFEFFQRFFGHFRVWPGTERVKIKMAAMSYDIVLKWLELSDIFGF